MRVVFAGTPEFAQQALLQIVQAGYCVPLVLTQPDRPAGRGLQLQPSPVKQTALEHGLTLATRDTAAFARVPRLKLFNPWGYKPEEQEEDWGEAAKAGAQWLRNIFVRG